MLLKQLPNTLTVFRVILIPFYILFFYLSGTMAYAKEVATAVFVLACLTDLLDGYLARKMNVCSKFGAFLDPVADKIMVCVALVLLVGHYAKYEGDYSYIPYISVIVGLCACVIVSREIVISALREWMAEVGSRSKVAVSWIGKWKTTIQMISIAGLIWRYNDLMVIAAVIVMVIATILTIWSMIDYMIVGFAYMSSDAPIASMTTKDEAITLEAKQLTDLVEQDPK